jgi:oligopeptide/dipeptide ABC transporter ATP-binding protein
VTGNDNTAAVPPVPGVPGVAVPGVAAVSGVAGVGGVVPPVLEVDSLSVEFLTERGWTEVVRDVSFVVGRDETLGIVGESGSGKTVTAMAIMGLLRKGNGRLRSGRVMVDGRDIAHLTTRQMNEIRGDRIAMIFQEPMTSLNPAYTVGNQIAETIRHHRRVSRKQAWAQACEALSLVGIANAPRRAGSYPHEFSGGMRQRAMIAMALSCEPALLIADEPTTALDVTIQAQILDLLRQMRAEFGLSILFITHDLGVVADICERVVVMYAGQVVEQSPVVDLFHRPVHPYTDGLLMSTPNATAAERTGLHSITGNPPLAGRFPGGCRFHPRCPHAEAACATTEMTLRLLASGQTTRCARVDELDLAGIGHRE